MINSRIPAPFQKTMNLDTLLSELPLKYKWLRQINRINKIRKIKQEKEDQLISKWTQYSTHKAKYPNKIELNDLNQIQIVKRILSQRIQELNILKNQDIPPQILKMFDKAFEMLQELKIKLKKTGKQKLRQFCTNKKKPLSKFDTFYSLNTQQTQQQIKMQKIQVPKQKKISNYEKQNNKKNRFSQNSIKTCVKILQLDETFQINQNCYQGFLKNKIKKDEIAFKSLHAEKSKNNQESLLKESNVSIINENKKQDFQVASLNKPFSIKQKKQKKEDPRKNVSQVKSKVLFRKNFSQFKEAQINKTLNKDKNKERHKFLKSRTAETKQRFVNKESVKRQFRLMNKVKPKVFSRYKKLKQKSKKKKKKITPKKQKSFHNSDKSSSQKNKYEEKSQTNEHLSSESQEDTISHNHPSYTESQLNNMLSHLKRDFVEEKIIKKRKIEVGDKVELVRKKKKQFSSFNTQKNSKRNVRKSTRFSNSEQKKMNFQCSRKGQDSQSQKKKDSKNFQQSNKNQDNNEKSVFLKRKLSEEDNGDKNLLLQRKVKKDKKIYRIDKIKNPKYVINHSDICKLRNEFSEGLRDLNIDKCAFVQLQGHERKDNNFYMEMRDPIELFIESKYSKKEKKFFDEYSTLYKVIKKLKYTNNTHSLYQTDGLGQKLEIPYKI